MLEMRRIARWFLFIALALGYAFLAHFTNIAPQMESLGLAVALAPIVVAAFSLAWHSARRLVALILFGLASFSLVLGWQEIAQHYSVVYWLEHAGTEVMLGLLFGRTLFAGREPMCSYFARMMHGSLSPALAHYTRQVTVAWVIFFFAMACISSVLFLLAPLRIWSAFANFFTAPLIGFMFVVEYLVRRLRLPDIEHAHILDGIKAFWKQPAR